MSRALEAPKRRTLRRLSVPPGTRGYLVLLAATVLAAAVVSPLVASIGAAAALVIVVLGTRSPRDECALCLKPLGKVDQLVRGPTAAICDRCAGRTLRMVADELDRDGQPHEWQGRCLDTLPARCPVRISRPLLEAMAASASDTSSLREAIERCLRLENNELACDLYQRIPEDERQARDWVNLGVALSKCGRFGDAITATSRARESDDDPIRPWCLNNVALFRLKLEPDAPASARAEWIREVEEAQRLLLETRPPGWMSILRASRVTEAELRSSLGDRAGATEALARAEELGPLSGEGLLVRARTLADSDEPWLAEVEARSALEALHPDSREAREAKELLDSLGQRRPG
jgi:tetratricopeptide (TPR) repeat protein